MFLLNESNFRLRFPGCTRHLRQKAKPADGATPSRTDDPSSIVEPSSDESPVEQEARELREVETVTGILDIRGVGLMSFWKVKDLLGQVIRISDVRLPSRAV